MEKETLGSNIVKNIPVIGGLASSILNSISAKRNTDRTIRANRELADYQYSKNLENWHMQNAYNSPAAQMQRFKDAGLNPHLIYGGGSGNAGNAAQIGSYQAPRAEYNYKPLIDPLSMLASYQQFQLNRANIDNVKADTELKLANSYYKSEAMRDLLDVLKNKRMISDAEREMMATKLGFFMSPITDELGRESHRGWELLKYQFQSREQDVPKAIAETKAKLAQARLTNATADLYDWGFWSKMAQGFGLKLPILNFKKSK